MDFTSHDQASQGLVAPSRDLQSDTRHSPPDALADGNGHHPAKRQRILACKRCRHRKQKCDGDGDAPCSNCRRASEECEPTEPALGRARYKTEYVRALEQRLARIEPLLPQDALSGIDTTTVEPESIGTNQSTQDLSESNMSSSNRAIVEDQNIQSSTFPLRAAFADSASSYNGSIIHDHEGIRNINDVAAATNIYGSGASPARTHQSQNSHASLNLRCSPGFRRVSFEESPHSQEVLDSNMNNVIATLPSVRPLQHNNHRSFNSLPPHSVEGYLTQLAVWPDAIPPSVEDHLIDLYFENSNSRFPFLLRDNFHVWHTVWKQRPRELDQATFWQGFFVNMLFAIGLLLDPKNPTSVSHTSQNFYDQAVSRYLPLVLKHPSRLLHVQAYLMMSLHAIFSPSTEQIALMISSTMRYCIVAQFHLAEAEPEPKDDNTRVEIQMRRRAFWVAYGLDRLACGVLRLPLSIADDNITIPLFDNIDDSALSKGSLASFGPLAFTSVSAALHQERCRTIQSEILNVTMRSDFSANFNSLSDWRSYILLKLERWRSQLEEAAESNSKRPTDWRWILIVYNHCLLFLHIPTKSNVRGQAGDWSLRASIQTIMIFRKFQSYKTIPHPWLGLISQFSVGITILYCLWATPPKFRSDAYNPKRVLEAVRACSNNIAIMTERWERAKDLLDVFEIFATEVPLVESASSYSGSHGGRASARISNDAAEDIREKLPSVKSMVLNREIIRMMVEIITEDFPAEDDTPIDVFTDMSDKVNIEPLANSQTFPNNNINNNPTYQFPSLYLSGNPSSSEIGTLLMGQSIDFPDPIPDYEVY